MSNLLQHIWYNVYLWPWWCAGPCPIYLIWGSSRVDGTCSLQSLLTQIISTIDCKIGLDLQLLLQMSKGCSRRDDSYITLDSASLSPSVTKWAQSKKEQWLGTISPQASIWNFFCFYFHVCMLAHFHHYATDSRHLFGRCSVISSFTRGPPCLINQDSPLITRGR